MQENITVSKNKILIIADKGDEQILENEFAKIKRQYIKDIMINIKGLLNIEDKIEGIVNTEEIESLVDIEEVVYVDKGEDLDSVKESIKDLGVDEFRYVLIHLHGSLIEDRLIEDRLIKDCLAEDLDEEDLAENRCSHSLSISDEPSGFVIQELQNITKANNFFILSCNCGRNSMSNALKGYDIKGNIINWGSSNQSIMHNFVIHTIGHLLDSILKLDDIICATENSTIDSIIRNVSNVYTIHYHNRSTFEYKKIKRFTDTDPFDNNKEKKLCEKEVFHLLLKSIDQSQNSLSSYILSQYEITFGLLDRFITNNDLEFFRHIKPFITKDSLCDKDGNDMLYYSLANGFYRDRDESISEEIIETLASKQKEFGITSKVVDNLEYVDDNNNYIIKGFEFTECSKCIDFKLSDKMIDILIEHGVIKDDKRKNNMKRIRSESSDIEEALNISVGYNGSKRFRSGSIDDDIDVSFILSDVADKRLVAGQEGGEKLQTMNS